MPDTKVTGPVAIRVDIALTYDVNPAEYDADKAPGIALEEQEIFDEGGLDLADLIASAKETLSVEFRPE